MPYNLLKAIVALFSIFLLTISLKITATEGVWQSINTVTPSIKALETTPYGILYGEFGNTSPTFYNGLFLSKDLGKTWEKIGLKDQGIQDIKYFDKKIYVATYYTNNTNQRLFISDNGGQTWQQTGPQATGSKVDRDDQTIYFGTFSYGLWISRDEGISWQRADNNWDYHADIYEIYTNNVIALASTENNTYISYDHGNNWAKVTYLSGRKIRNIAASDNLLIVGSDEKPGLFISTDNGITWKEINFFKGYIPGAIKITEKHIFVARKNNGFDNKSTLFVSQDKGETWVNTNLDLEAIKNISLLSSSQATNQLLYAVIPTKGMFEFNIPSYFLETNMFLDIPFNYTDTSELMSKISAYFDHKYPLLGNEPIQYQNSTVSFTGDNVTYYSSHNGTDYKLPYGSEIKTAAPGIATYYYCNDCGHTIRVNHQNGYETIYMHLQDSGLITKNKTSGVWVSANQTIGLVGMSGNTTGPHLHFSVNKLERNIVDPYGWLSLKPDPWYEFSKIKSVYLWNTLLPIAAKYTYPYQKITLNTKNAAIEYDNTTDIPSTISVFTDAIPHLNGYIYIGQTALDINLMDLTGKFIVEPLSPVKIIYDLAKLQLNNIDIGNLKIMRYDDINDKWIPLPTGIDHIANQLVTLTPHLSKFAVFVEKPTSNIPNTELEGAPPLTNDWITNELTLTLKNTDNHTIYAALSTPNSLELYKQPYEINSPGIYKLYYRAEDNYENTEELKEVLVKYKGNNFTKKIKVSNTAFSVN